MSITADSLPVQRRSDILKEILLALLLVYLSILLFAPALRVEARSAVTTCIVFDDTAQTPEDGDHPGSGIAVSCDVSPAGIRGLWSRVELGYFVGERFRSFSRVARRYRSVGYNSEFVCTLTWQESVPSALLAIRKYPDTLQLKDCVVRV